MPPYLSMKFTYGTVTATAKQYVYSSSRLAICPHLQQEELADPDDYHCDAPCYATGELPQSAQSLETEQPSSKMAPTASGNISPDRWTQKRISNNEQEMMVTV